MYRGQHGLKLWYYLPDGWKLQQHLLCCQEHDCQPYGYDLRRSEAQLLTENLIRRIDAVLSAMLSMEGRHVTEAEGIIDKDVDRSIKNLTSLGKDAMCATDDMVLNIMTNKNGC